MRYVVMALIVIISIALVFGVFAAVNFWGIIPDIILLSLILWCCWKSLCCPRFFSLSERFLWMFYLRGRLDFIQFRTWQWDYWYF